MSQQRSAFFSYKTQQIRFKVKELQKSYQIAYFRPDSESKLFLLATDEALNVVNQKGELKLAYKKTKTSSNIVRLSPQKAAIYSPNPNQIAIVDLASLQVEQKMIEAEPKYNKPQYQLLYFSSLDCVALVEKNNAENKLNISYFQQRENQYKLLFNFKAEDGQWNSHLTIFKLNESGVIGWCDLGDQGINLHICSLGQGYKKGSLQNIFPVSAEVAGIANDGSNLIHLAVTFKQESQVEHLPVMVIETSNGFQNFQRVRFAQGDSSQKIKFSQVTGVKNDGKLISFKAKSSNKLKMFVYSLQNENLVGQFQIQQTQAFQFITCPLRTIGRFDYIQSTKQLTVVLYIIQQKKSQVFSNILRNIEKINEIVKTNSKALLIFGVRKSGKSTFRHFLCGKELQHIFHQELSYYQLKCKNDQYNHQDHTSVWIDANKQGAVIQFPDFTENPQLISQIIFILQAIFKKFKGIHFAVAIPIQQIQQPETYERVFQSIIQLIQKAGVALSQSELGDYMSVILTKVQDSDSIQRFRENIELLKEENEKIGTVLERINSIQHIINFDNNQYNLNEQQEIVSNLFNSQTLSTQKSMYQKLQEQLTSTDQGESLLKQLQVSIRNEYCLTNHLLLYLGHVLASVPHNFSIESVNQQQKQQFGKFFNKDENNINLNELVYPFFMVLSELKLIVQQKANQNSQRISHLHKYLLLLSNKYQELTTQRETVLLKTVAKSFIASLILEVQFLRTINNSQNIGIVNLVFKNSPYSILGNVFKLIIQKLSQNEAVISERSVLESLKPYLGESKGRVVLKKVKVPMSYQKQKQSYLKNKAKILETIYNLPANAMKLDLILQQIIEFMRKQRLQDQDIRKLRFYLREASRICHFHELFVEAIILLMIIPDFIGIQILLEEMVQNCKKKNTIQSKKLFSKAEDELIEQLILISRQCIRDSLVSKLLYIKSLNKEVGQKQFSIKKFETNLRNKQLSKKQALNKYLQKLKKQTELCFYNLKNESFKKLIDNRKGLIQQCIRYQKEQPTSSTFADIEALNWVVQKIPIPA